MNQSDLKTFCRRQLPFSGLTEEALTALLAASRQRAIPAKEYVFLEGTAGDAGYLILSGRIAMVKTSPNGREMIMELLPAGEFFGIVALIDDRPYPLTARAQSDIEVLAIPRSAIAPLAETNPGLLQGFLSVVSQRLLTAHNIARSLAHDKVEVRIAAALLALLGKDVNSVDIGRQELADLTGTTIESASRTCKVWERDGVLDLSAQGVVRILDRESLQNAAHGGE